jgi:membrane protease YdiL (CAAX protease family)
LAEPVSANLMEETTEFEISDKRRILEIIAVLITGIGKFVFMDYLNLKFPYILISIIAWTVYILMRKSRVNGIMNYWGFRMDNFRIVFRSVIPFGILAIVSFVLVGLIRNTLNPSWHIIPILITYPIWGVIQQFLVIGLVAGNLQDMKKNKLKEPIIILLTAILFAGIHYPYNWLILGTFVLALFYGYIYLKGRNIYVLGLFHGWLGGLFFYTVVNRDPLMEVFGKYIN